MKCFLFWGLILALLSGCSKAPFGQGGCGADIDWVDFVKLNDITYDHLSEYSQKVDDSQLGEKIGEVRYTLNNHACTDHKSKNGDAAYLAVGTPIYAVKDYAPTFRVVADHTVYQANENPRAQIVSDFWDIKDRVDRVSLDTMSTLTAAPAPGQTESWTNAATSTGEATVTSIVEASAKSCCEAA